MRLNEGFAREAAVAAEAYHTLPSAGAESRVVAASRSYEVRGEPHPGCCAQLLSCTCANQGGCCTISPPQVIISHEGVVQRVNLLIRIQGCCSNSGTGMIGTVTPDDRRMSTVKSTDEE